MRCGNLLLARIAYRKLVGELGTGFIALALDLGDGARKLGCRLALLLADLRTQGIGLTLGVGLSFLNGQLACGIGTIETGLELSDLGVARSKLVLGSSCGVGLC